MEDKQEICRYLLWALQKTRGRNTLMDLIYHPDTEIVRAVILTPDGYRNKKINVAADSGIAMMKDIIKALE